MSKGNRDNGFKVVNAVFIALIVGLFVMLIYDSGRKHGKAVGEYEANTDTYASHTEDEIIHCLTLPEDGSKTKCIREVVESSNEHERAERDLVAQTEMALWSLGMLVVSALMAVVTGVGVWFVWQTLIATQAMAKDTRDMGEKQVRAYITLKDCRIDGIAEGQKVTAFLNFVNSGHSPCYITATAIGIGYEPTPIKTTPVLAPETKLTPSSEGAGREFSHTISTKRELNFEEFAAYTSGEMGFVVTCEITYKDVFGHERQTIETVYRTVHKPADANGLSTLSVGNKHT